MVYSRSRRPEFQPTSINISRNGSAIGTLELIRMTGCPLACCSTLKRKPVRAAILSMRACLKASAPARRTLTPASSSLLRESNSISARSGWPKADWTLSLPNPAASAPPTESSKTHNNALVFMVLCISPPLSSNPLCRNGTRRQSVQIHEESHGLGRTYLGGLTLASNLPAYQSNFPRPPRSVAPPGAWDRTRARSGDVYPPPGCGRRRHHRFPQHRSPA